MRHRWRHAAVACVLCACGSDSEAEDVAITVLVTEVTSDEPDPDTEVCVVVPTGYGCATTGADGRVTLNVPASSDVVFRSTRSDRMTGLFAYTSGDAPEEIEVDTADPTLAQVLLLGAGVIFFFLCYQSFHLFLCLFQRRLFFFFFLSHSPR